MAIIKAFDVKENIGHRLLARLVMGMMHQPHFQGAKETFHHGVIVTIPSAAPADLHPVGCQQLLKHMTGILAAAKASGKKLGSPKGSRDKERVLDPFRDQMIEYLELGLSLRRIRTIINPPLERKISYPAYRYFVRQDTELLQL